MNVDLIKQSRVSLGGFTKWYEKVFLKCCIYISEKREQEDQGRTAESERREPDDKRISTALLNYILIGSNIETRGTQGRRMRSICNNWYHCSDHCRRPSKGQKEKKSRRRRRETVVRRKQKKDDPIVNDLIQKKYKISNDNVCNNFYH